MSLWNRAVRTLGDEMVRAIGAGIVGLAVILASMAISPVQDLLFDEHRIRGIIVAALIVLVLAGAVSVWTLARRARRLAAEASTDFQLNVFNARECRRRLEEIIGESDRYGRPFSIGLVDVDGLKAANDAHGYDSGDRLLREFVEFTKRHLRQTDILFRYRQGDEFLILYKDTDPAAARVPAERLRRGIADYEFQGHMPGDSFTMTISVGVVGYDPAEKGMDIDRLLRRAEVALARAKESKNATWLESGAAPRD